MSSTPNRAWPYVAPSPAGTAAPGEPTREALAVVLRGVGLLGPGLPDWTAGQALLREPSRWSPQPTQLAAPARLPAAERRRAGAVVKLSLAVADQACAQAGIDTRTLATVFTSSSGDAANCHALCEALATVQRIVSPTRFTNSVHNAAAGYWHIATASRAPSSSLCGHDASFAAGLLEAVTQCVAWQRPVLLVAGDVPYPEPLHSVRPLPDAFGLALLLAPPSAAPALGRLSLRLGGEAPARSLDDERLAALCRAVPAARGLPLLQALARGEAATLRLDDLEHCPLFVEIVAGEPAP
jgi:hypothetical protein